jgi:CheY-like chemotaxis protein
MIIEDEDLQYEIYEEFFAEFSLLRARSGSEAIALLAKWLPQVIVLDHILDDAEQGLDFLPDLKKLLPHVPVIVVSGALEVQDQMEALQGPRRAHYCLSKPVDLEELRKTIQTALDACGEQEVIQQFQSLERSRRSDIEELLTRSTDRLNRQHQIRMQLRDSSDKPNISALARDYKVARRTIIRDLQEMI